MYRVHTCIFCSKKLSINYDGVIRLMILEIEGTPRAKQSFRYTLSGIKYQPKELKDSETTFIKGVICQIKNNYPDFQIHTKSVEIDYRFINRYFDSMTKKQKMFTKYKQTKPDIDNLMKFTNDCLTKAGVVVDDSLIVKITATKEFGLQSKTILTIKEI